ncbi:MAG: ROK family protein [Cyclobacteriaceae bacterium]
MDATKIIGVDLGGTKVQAGVIENGIIQETQKIAVSSQGTEQEVIDEVIKSIEAVFNGNIAGIGVGVPSIVDVQNGIVYDVQNIPSWKEVRLKEILEEQFKVPVYVDNDANCFAAGEKHFGKGQDHQNFVALIIGTGLAAGIIIDHKLYHGHNCGAGEFGMIPYLDAHYELYCSGQYFANSHQTSGETLHKLAIDEDEQALNIFQEYGTHLGSAIKTILYSYDPELIILGGSVSKTYPFFREALWKQLDTFAYRNVVPRLTIEVSDQPDIAILGAAALYFQAQANHIRQPVSKPS